MPLLRLDSLDNVLSSSPGIINRKRYTPFGVVTPITGSASGFHGQLNERVFDGYLLGNGYRLYLPSLMRFLEADEHSPFGKGGINAYAFCGGDPVNQQDLTGRAPSFRFLTRLFRKPPKFTAKFPVTIKNPIRHRSFTVPNKTAAKHAFKLQTNITAVAHGKIIGGNGIESIDQYLAFDRQRERLYEMSKTLGVTKEYFEHRMAKAGMSGVITWREPQFLNQPRAVPNEYA